VLGRRATKNVTLLFRAEKELFESLAIAGTDWEWKTHPVIHLDLSARNYAGDGVGTLKDKLNSQLKQCAKNYGVNKVSVYNTYGLLNHFDKSADFTPYWSMSGRQG
jgi:hypothetical protein